MNGMAALRWFWTFVTSKEPIANAWDKFWTARTHYIQMCRAVQLKLIGCQHYITNHLYEDYTTWGPLWYLMCEGSEANHAISKRYSKYTCKNIFTHGKRNCCEVVCINRALMFSLYSTGVFKR